MNSLEVVNYQDTLMVSAKRLDEFKLHTAKDEDLQEVSRMITDGWLESRQETPFATHAYFNYRGELHAEMDYSLRVIYLLYQRHYVSR